MAKKGLGRGLGVIFGNETESRQTSQRTAKRSESVSRETPEIDIALVVPNPSQPRKHFDDEALRELAGSIAQHGVLQPILVKKKGRRYELIIGERRLRAAKLAGLKTIPAIVKEMDGREAAEAALIENIQREDLGAIEEARAYRALIDEYSLTQEELAAKVSKSRAAIANSLRLLKLDPEILELIEDGSLTAGHARAVLSIGGKGKQLKAAREISSRGLSVRDAEKLAKRYNGEGQEIKTPDGKREDTAYFRAAEQSLMSAMGVKVAIRRTGGEKGRVEIEYTSMDELNGIIEKITKTETL